MRIKSITLYTHKLTDQKIFYNQTLGFPIIEECDNSFMIQTGYSNLTFKRSDQVFHYHYCFLIPSNKIQEAINWLQQRLELVIDKEGRIIHRFESWNAHAIYFWDGSGNLAEFIIRHDLNNETDQPFDRSQILNFNEIGMPTSGKVQQLNSQLETILNSKFWKGDLERFATNGTQEGLFLLINNNIKKTWFPTSLETQSCPFEAVIEADEQFFNIAFKNQELEINHLTSG